VRQEQTLVRLTDRSQIKLMYGSHHQQPQKYGRNDELDPYLVVREPSMHAIHGQRPSQLPRYNRTGQPITSAANDRACTLFVPTLTSELD